MEESLLSDLEAQIFVLPSLWQAGMDEVNPAGSQKKILKWKYTFAFGIFFVRIAGISLREIEFRGLQNRGAQRLIFSNS